MHARQLCSLALTRFLLHSSGLPLRMYGMQRTQCYHGHRAYLDQSGVTVSGSAVQSKSSFPVHCLSCAHHEISQLYCYKPRSKHRAIMVKSAQLGTSGPKIFHYPKSQICITSLLEIILNSQLITT